MANLSGIKNAEYLAQFLGKKILIRVEQGKQDKFALYPILYNIDADHNVQVIDSEDRLHTFTWEQCENPYMILIGTIKWEQR